jgi:hypothetical protein
MVHLNRMLLEHACYWNTYACASNQQARVIQYHPWVHHPNHELCHHTDGVTQQQCNSISSLSARLCRTTSTVHATLPPRIRTDYPTGPSVLRGVISVVAEFMVRMRLSVQCNRRVSRKTRATAYVLEQSSVCTSIFPHPLVAKGG